MKIKAASKKNAMAANKLIFDLVADHGLYIKDKQEKRLEQLDMAVALFEATAMLMICLESPDIEERVKWLLEHKPPLRISLAIARGILGINPL